MNYGYEMSLPRSQLEVRCGPEGVRLSLDFSFRLGAMALYGVVRQPG